MTAASTAIAVRFLAARPTMTAKALESLSDADAVAALEVHAPEALAPAWRKLSAQVAARYARRLPVARAAAVLAAMPGPEAARIMGHVPAARRAELFAEMANGVRRDLESLLSFPPDTAGRLMDPAVRSFRESTIAAAAVESMRDRTLKTARTVFVVDDDHRLTGVVLLQDLALAAPDAPLADLMGPPPIALRPTDPASDVAEAFERGDALDIPILNLDGVFLGAVTHDDIAQTIQDDVSSDIQAMVGASRDERALSSPLLAVRKRMPWLQVNLLTAFLAASVVGLFEATIAQVTALAVLLPIVAGQAGNAGAQALAITMRGLALRDVTTRHWAKVARKEVMAGFLNGLAISFVCGVGVYLWSQSALLVVVIVLAMVLAMMVAGLAGAIIPMALKRLGQDPATSSSIILTTVTDIVGFGAFLAIAAALI